MARWHMRDTDRLEKVAKIRKKSRKKTHAVQAGETFLRKASKWTLGGETQAFAARVVEVHKRYAFVSTESAPGVIDTRDVWLAEVARRFLVSERSERNFVAVGDYVLCIPDREQVIEAKSDLPKCVIQHLDPRHAKIARLDPHTPEREHVLASNMDQVLIVASYLSPKVKWGLIDRYLVLAESEGIRAIIALNKYDLLQSEGKPEQIAEAEAMTKLYRSLGYEVFSLQANARGAKRNAEIMRLRELLDQKVTLLTGHSGVGKSSLVNLYRPEIVQAVEPDDDIFYKGRHTTSFASFIKLGTGGYVIDTPGIRSFTFEEKTAIELSHCFVEFRPLLGQCKFRECRHLDEPGCMVLAAVEAGTIDPWRYKSYQAILFGATGREGRVRDLGGKDRQYDDREVNDIDGLHDLVETNTASGSNADSEVDDESDAELGDESDTKLGGEGDEGDEEPEVNTDGSDE